MPCGGWRSGTAMTTSILSRCWPGKMAAVPAYTTTGTGSGRRAWPPNSATGCGGPLLAIARPRAGQPGPNRRRVPGGGDEDSHDEHGLTRTPRSGLPAEHQRREVDHGERVHRRHPPHPQVGPGRAGRRPAGPCTIPALAMTADRRHRPMDRQHDQHHRRPPPQRQCDRAEHGSQRRAAAYGDQRVHTISGRDTERGEHASPQRRPRRQGHQICRDRSHWHGDAIASQEPREQGGDHNRARRA